MDVPARREVQHEERSAQQAAHADPHEEGGVAHERTCFRCFGARERESERERERCVGRGMETRERCGCFHQGGHFIFFLFFFLPLATVRRIFKRSLCVEHDDDDDDDDDDDAP